MALARDGEPGRVRGSAVRHWRSRRDGAAPRRARPRGVTARGVRAGPRRARVRSRARVDPGGHARDGSRVARPHQRSHRAPGATRRLRARTRRPTRGPAAARDHEGAGLVRGHASAGGAAAPGTGGPGGRTRRAPRRRRGAGVALPDLAGARRRGGSERNPACVSGGDHPMPRLRAEDAERQRRRARSDGCRGRAGALRRGGARRRCARDRDGDAGLSSPRIRARSLPLRGAGLPVGAQPRPSPREVPVPRGTSRARKYLPRVLVAPPRLPRPQAHDLRLRARAHVHVSPR